MRILLACEMSGIGRQAFRSLGHDAWSCDVLPSMDNSPFHYQEDILTLLSKNWDWDLMIAHPPCTRLCVSGARWFKHYLLEQDAAINFVERLWTAPILKIAIENPIGVLSTRSTLGKPTQIIQPWEFGHEETKATCLWLKNLPKLQSTEVMEFRWNTVHLEPPGLKNGFTRSQRRSMSYEGIAKAMAEQWSSP